MAFIQKQEVYATGGGHTMFPIIQDLISVGWRVKGSGNNTAFENEGQTSGTTGTGAGGGYDLITSATVLVTKTNNVGCSWIRLATPSDAPFYRELLIQNNFYSGATTIEWRLEWLIGGHEYDTGATAGILPTSSTGTGTAFGHEKPARSSGVDDYSNLFTSTVGAQCWAWNIGDVDENYDFMAISWRPRNSSALFSYFGSAYVATPFPGNEQDLSGGGAGGVDVDPYIYFFGWDAASSTPTITAGADDLQVLNGSDTKQEGKASTTEVGCFASYKLGQSDEYSGTYRVALCNMGGEVSSTFTNMPHVNNPVYTSAPITGPEVIGPALVYKGHSTTYVNFCKGYYSGNMFKMGYKATSTPYTVRPWDDVGLWYANFGGFHFAWYPLRGLWV